MRTDKLKNIQAMKKEYAINPLQTEEQVAEKIGINRKTVNRLKQEMPEIVAKQDDILAITNVDREIIELSQYLSKWKLLVMKKAFEENWDIELRDVKTGSEIAKESTARYSLFRWSATDEQWGLKQIDSIDIL